MDSTERLVRTWVASGRDEEIEEIVTEISNGQTTLLNVVKALGEYLTSEEDELRTKGVDLLSSVLGRCPPEKLNRQSARVLVAFYCGKLDDTETITPALKGLSSLTTLPNCISSDAVVIVQALFSHVKMKALVQSTRFFVFSIIDTLMARHRDALKNMGDEFLSGYIALAEGEKDPRNLLIAFAIARVILIEFKISDHVESLFNITFCYFPITFRPPPNDPYGITTDDLRLALRSCLNATPAFGPLAVPIFLEKLTAGSPTTKRDTLQAMASCLPVYGSALARGCARQLWNSLKLEIFQPTDPLTEDEALKTTQVLVKTIHGESDSGHGSETQDVEGFARDACEECINILREPEKSQAKPAIKVLCAFVSTTPSVSRYTMSQAVPHLVKIFLNPDETLNRPPVLLLLSELVIAARDSISNDTGGLNDKSQTPLMPYKDEVLGVFTVGLKTSASRRAALDGLKGMVTTPTLLTDEELGFIVHNVNEILQGDPDESNDVSDVTLNLLSTISTISPRHVEEQTLPLLFSSLPDQAPPREAATERAKYWRVLSALSELCLPAELFEILVIRLTTKLDLLCAPAVSSSSPLPIDTEPTAAYSHSILTTIAKTLTTKVDNGHVDVPKYINQLVPRIYNLFIYSALAPNATDMVATNTRLIAVAAQIITIVAQTLSVQRQEKMAESLVSAYLTGNVKAIAEGLQKLPADVNFLPFNNAATAFQKNLVPLFSAAIITLHKEIQIPVPDINAFLNQILTWSLNETETTIQRDAAWHVVASIINKRVDDVTPFLSDKLSTYWAQEIADTSVPLERRRNAIRSWIWLSKALLVRNHPQAMRFTDRIFEVFDDESINWDAARAIGDISGNDKIFTKRNHAVIKILYAQKFFNGVLPRIIEGAKDTTKPNQQTAYLVALTSLIKSIPKTTYAHEMPVLMPLLLRGLELPDAEIRANVIDTLLAAAEGDSPEKSIVSEYASTLVSTMLKNSLINEMPTMRVRIAALRYLGTLPDIIRYDVLHPYKSTVIRELAKVLDDPKRSVRKVAVEARTNWFKYNG